MLIPGDRLVDALKAFQAMPEAKRHRLPFTAIHRTDRLPGPAGRRLIQRFAEQVGEAPGDAPGDPSAHGPASRYAGMPG